MTTIMGIDPGSLITGYGIIQQEGRRLSYLGSGCIKTKVDNLSTRLKMIYTKISEIINHFQPNCLAIEQVFVSKNANSALKLGQARGAAIVAAVNLNIPVFEYAARQVKLAVVGSGAANKNQVQYMVCNILTLTSSLQIDAADALAIAITHCYVTQNTLFINSINFNSLKYNHIC